MDFLVVTGRELSLQKKLANGLPHMADIDLIEKIVHRIKQEKRDYEPDVYSIESVLLDAEWYRIHQNDIADELRIYHGSKKNHPNFDDLKKICGYRCFPFYINFNIDNLVFDALTEVWEEKSSAVSEKIKIGRINLFANSDSPEYRQVLENKYKENDFNVIDVFGNFHTVYKTGYQVAYQYDKRIEAMLKLMGVDGNSDKMIFMQSLLEQHPNVIFLGCNYEDFHNVMMLYTLFLRKRPKTSNWLLVNRDYNIDTYTTKFVLNKGGKIYGTRSGDNIASFTTEIAASLKGLYQRRTSNPNRIFISYVRENFDVAIALYRELKNLYLNVWIDQTDIHLFRSLSSDIRTTIERADTYILLFSKELTDRGRESYVVSHEWPYMLKQSTLAVNNKEVQSKLILPVFVNPVNIDKLDELRNIALKNPKYMSGIDSKTAESELENWTDYLTVSFENHTPRQIAQLLKVEIDERRRTAKTHHER